MSTDICFVLGSGGSRGIAHIGFLQAMEENGIKPDIIIGCSMGSVVGSCYASGLTPKYLKEYALNLKALDIIDLDFAPISRNGLLKSIKLQKHLKVLLKDSKFEDLKIPFECVATDMKTGELITLNKGYVEEAVRASSSIPLVFKPVEKDNMMLVDGGILCRVPVQNAYKYNPKVIIAVDVLGKLKDYDNKNNMITQLLRMVDVSDNQANTNYLNKYKPDLLLMPELRNMSQYKVEKIEFAYEQGYKMGIENIDKIKNIIKQKI